MENNASYLILESLALSAHSSSNSKYTVNISQREYWDNLKFLEKDLEIVDYWDNYQTQKGLWVLLEISFHKAGVDAFDQKECVSIGCRDGSLNCNRKLIL